MHRNCESGFNSGVSEGFYGDASSRNLSPDTCFEIGNQKSVDRSFIDNFILKVLENKKIQKPKPHSFGISKGKSLLLDIVRTKKNLAAAAADLFVDDENFDEKWEEITKEAEKLRGKMLHFDENVKKEFIKATAKRLKKRNWEKRRNLKFEALRKEFKSQVSEKHAFIDEWLNQRQKEVEGEKRKAALKLQADSVLHGVRRKTLEAKKMLNLLSALSKLRELRQKQAEERGENSSKDSHETFLYAVGKFQKLWENQMYVYKAEEKKLRLLLEENVTLPARKAELEQNLVEWEKLLFGDISSQETDCSIQALVQARKDWDGFLVGDATPMASSLPSGWVLPGSHWGRLTNSTK